MKFNRYLVVLPMLLIFVSAFGATIRVYNKLGNGQEIIVTAITPKKRIPVTIKSMGNYFFNTWFSGINGFEWTENSATYKAPLEMRALQTEGRLHIKRGGKYSFKPCLPCKEMLGTAELVPKK